MTANTAWLIQLVGERWVLDHEHEPIRCAGSIMGSIHAMTIFLEATKTAYKAKWTDEMRDGIDQGMLNLLVASHAFDMTGLNVTSWRFGTWPAMQLALTRRICTDHERCLEELGLWSNDQLTNLDGRPLRHVWVS